MFLLITEWAPQPETQLTNLNTSHVLINRFAACSALLPVAHLNTSHVLINQGQQKGKHMKLNRFKYISGSY